MKAIIPILIITILSCMTGCTYYKISTFSDYNTHFEIATNNLAFEGNKPSDTIITITPNTTLFMSCNRLKIKGNIKLVSSPFTTSSSPTVEIHYSKYVKTCNYKGTLIADGVILKLIQK